MCSQKRADNRSDNGYVQPKNPNEIPTLQVPSNVTHISRCLKNICSDGTFQTIYYHTGVGSTATKSNKILGGAFGIGIAEVSALSPCMLDRY